MKVFLKILQSSQGNVVPESLFLIRLLAWGKKEALAQVFLCKFCEIFNNNFFAEHFWVTTSGNFTKTVFADLFISRLILTYILDF